MEGPSRNRNPRIEHRVVQPPPRIRRLIPQEAQEQVPTSSMAAGLPREIPCSRSSSVIANLSPLVREYASWRRVHAVPCVRTSHDQSGGACDNRLMSNGEFMMTIRVLLTLSLAGSAAAVGTTAQGVRPGFYVVGTFSGSSMGDDAPIWDARIQGTGAVYVAGGDPALELVVRQKPSAAAPVVAYLGTVKGGDGGLHSIYAANEPNLIGEMERVSHEEYGLVAEMVQDGWVRAVYGYTRTGQVRRGWVKLMAGGVEYRSYDEQILEHMTWFEEPDSVELFDRPNGRRIRLPLARAANADSDYELEVVSIRGSWIDVQVTVPNTNACGGNPEAKVERRTRAWVRRYDHRGRYQIAYAAAGC